MSGGKVENVSVPPTPVRYRTQHEENTKTLKERPPHTNLTCVTVGPAAPLSSHLQTAIQLNTAPSRRKAGRKDERLRTNRGGLGGGGSRGALSTIETDEKRRLGGWLCPRREEGMRSYIPPPSPPSPPPPLQGKQPHAGETSNAEIPLKEQQTGTEAKPRLAAPRPGPDVER